MLSDVRIVEVAPERWQARLVIDDWAMSPVCSESWRAARWAELHGFTVVA